jgi:hypothetical protein
MKKEKPLKSNMKIYNAEYVNKVLNRQIEFMGSNINFIIKEEFDKYGNDISGSGYILGLKKALEVVKNYTPIDIEQFKDYDL